MPARRLSTLPPSSVASFTASMVASTSRGVPSRRTASFTFAPSGNRPSALRRSCAPRTGLPSMLVSTSPVCRPAPSAGEPWFTRVTTAPVVSFKPSAWAMRGVMSCTSTPRLPRRTLP